MSGDLPPALFARPGQLRFTPAPCRTFEYGRIVKRLGVGWLLIVAIVVGCEKEAGVTSADGGVDAGCPDYEPNDAGVVQLTRRGCPLRIDYAIR